MRLIFSQKKKSTRRQNDLLGLFICLAAILHTTVIFGVQFVPEERNIGQVLDVTLATFSDDKAPDKADFLAQANQEGSGTADQALVPKTPSVSEFQAAEVNPVVNTQSSMPMKQEPQETNVYTVLTSTSIQDEKENQEKEEDKEEKKGAEQEESSNEAVLEAKIASLQAEFADKQQEYAKRPKVLQITSAATKKDKGAAYQDAWRKKIEYIGNLNYPEEAKRKKIYGELRLLVAIKKNGQLHEVKILKSSGKPILDQAALRIVRMSAPFGVFPTELADTDIIEIIRTWRFDRSDRLEATVDKQ